jgi:uncharacterized membrane protein YeaQ/YmgE (transglycosylase-associated protein family)
MQLFLSIMDGFFAGWMTSRLGRNLGHNRAIDIAMGTAGAVAGGFFVTVTAAPFSIPGKMIYASLGAILVAVISTAMTRYLRWGERWDLNPRPSVPQTDALPAELRSPPGEYKQFTTVSAHGEGLQGL